MTPSIAPCGPRARWRTESGDETRVLRLKLNRSNIRIGVANVGHMIDERPGRGIPGVAGREFETGLRRYVERGQARGAQILIEDTDRRVADHIARAGHRKSRGRQPARQRFQQHQSKCVGTAWKHEHIRAA